MHADILWDTRPIQLEWETLLKFEATTRRRLPAFFLALTLAFAVSSWGLQYKLSLYHSLDARQGMPAAKLLSEKERPVISTHVERLRLSSRPFPAATYNSTPHGIAVLPADTSLIALQQREADELPLLSFYPPGLSRLAPGSPRPPPPTT